MMDLSLGGQSTYYKYNFRDIPFDYKISLSAAYATAPNDYSLHLAGYFNSLIKNATLNIEVFKTGLFFTEYHGYGNETSFSKELDEEDFYRLEQELFVVAPTLFLNYWYKTKFGFGVSYEFSEIELENETLLLNTRKDDYGLGNTKLFGTHLSLEIDTRDNLSNPYKGIYLNIKGSLYPKIVRC